MRDFLLFYLNGERVEVRGDDALLSLSDFLRERRRLTGTKVVCFEGDCGACTVLIGRPDGQRLRYQAVDSCILFLFQLDGAHVVTVEGLAQGGRLNAVQQAMIDGHGSQCGFCTPGFVMTLTLLLENDADSLQPRQVLRELTGNLCRCTGYVPIVEAAIEARRRGGPALAELFPPEPLLEELTRGADEAIEINGLFSPTTLSQATDFLAKHPQAKVVAGATDLGVQINKGMISPRVILDLNRVRELEQFDLAHGRLTAGARVTWTQLEQSFQHRLPQFHRILNVFGAPQIRNVATLGGNIINASPIADSLPFLFVAEAELDLQSSDGARRVNVNDFYLGYKRIDLQAGELLTKVYVPLPGENERLGLYKVSRRLDLDIASFTAAILVRLEKETIASAAIALGAVAPTVIRAPQTEAFLAGRPFNEETFHAAGDLAAGEISPISDVRGSSDFRTQLTRNVFVKFFHEAGPV